MYLKNTENVIDKKRKNCDQNSKTYGCHIFEIKNIYKKWWEQVFVNQKQVGTNLLALAWLLYGTKNFCLD
jgi:hypothetical protein